MADETKDRRPIWILWLLLLLLLVAAGWFFFGRSDDDTTDDSQSDAPPTATATYTSTPTDTPTFTPTEPDADTASDEEPEEATATSTDPPTPTETLTPTVVYVAPSNTPTTDPDAPVITTEIFPGWDCLKLEDGSYQWWEVEVTYHDGVAVSVEILSGPYSGGWVSGCPGDLPPPPPDDGSGGSGGGGDGSQDSDGDGFPDSQDACPNTPGPNVGCPPGGGSGD